MPPLIEMLKRLFGVTSPPESTEMRAIVIMQRKAYRFTEERSAGCRENVGGRRGNFSTEKEDPMYFVSAGQAASLTLIKAGPHVYPE